jgi:outer membrane autotransporter protein
MTEYDITRLAGGGFAGGSPDGDFNQLEFTTGLNFKSGALVHGPYASLRWLDGTVDAYTEAGPGGALFPSSDYESLATNLGYQVSYPIAMGAGVLVPQARLAWEHEFEDDQGSVLGLPGTEIDEDLAVVGAGIGFWFNNGWNVIADYEGRFGDNTTGNYIGLKAGYEF